MNAGISRVLITLIFGLFCVHLISCIWFLAAEFSDFDPDTWVARLGL
jgi:hypothetical protein